MYVYIIWPTTTPTVRTCTYGCMQGKEANIVNVLAETEVVSPSLPSSYTLLTQREPSNQVHTRDGNL